MVDNQNQSLKFSEPYQDIPNIRSDEVILSPSDR